MKNLIIIGAGGMGRTVYDNALESVGYGETFVVKGFIDDDLQALDGFPNYPPIIDTIRNYQPWRRVHGTYPPDGAYPYKREAGQGKLHWGLYGHRK